MPALLFIIESILLELQSPRARFFVWVTQLFYQHQHPNLIALPYFQPHLLLRRFHIHL